MRRPGAVEIRDPSTLENWLSAADDLARSCFLGSRRDGGDVVITLELAVENDEDDEDGEDGEDGEDREDNNHGACWPVRAREWFQGANPDEDDLRLPLWLVPARDWYQRVELRAAGGVCELDTSGLQAEDVPAAIPEDGWLLDAWHVGEHDGLVVRFDLREPCTPDVIIRAPRGIAVHVGEPAHRPASIGIDPDVVQLSFAVPVSSFDPPAGMIVVAVASQSNEHVYEARRGDASPETFVEFLRRVSDSTTFRRARSDDVSFDAETWRDYVTPGRRPWL